MNPRNLLAVTPALVGLAGAGLGAAAAAPNPDADLFAVCAEFNACDLRQRAIYDGPDAVEDDGKAALVAAPIFAQMHTLLDHMEHLRAATPAGIAARAGSLAQHSGGRAFSFDAQGTITGRLLDYLLRDAAALGKAGAAPSVHPDAELIALCAQLDALERAYLATDFAADDDTPAGDAAEAERERIAAAQEPIVDAICASPPLTPAGAVAVAHSLALWDAELLKKGGRGHCTDDRLLAALVRGLTGSASVPVPSLDAELLALCAEFHRLQASYTDDDNPGWDRFGPAAHAAFVAVQGVTPATEAGHRAKGRVALVKLEENHGDGMAGDTYAEFALTMLRDWLELPA